MAPKYSVVTPEGGASETKKKRNSITVEVILDIVKYSEK